MLGLTGIASFRGASAAALRTTTAVHAVLLLSLAPLAIVFVRGSRSASG